MARGKHKARASHRRASHNEALLAQLNSELEMEQAALSEAETTLADVTRLQTDLAAESAALLEEVAPYVDQLGRERDFLRSVFADARSHHARIHEAWDRVAGAAIDVAPGTQLEKVESLQRAMGLGNYLNTVDREGQSTNLEEITRIQRARRERRDVASDPTELGRVTHLTVALDVGMVRPTYRQLLMDKGVVVRDQDESHRLLDPDELTADQIALRTTAIALGDKIWDFRAGTLDVDAIPAWGTGNLITATGEPGGPRAALGFAPESKSEALNPAPHSPIGLPLPSAPAATRNTLARHAAEDVFGAWRGVFASRQLVSERLGLPSHPFAPLAHHPQPSQGLAVQNTYALAAFSGWIQNGAGSAYAQAAVGLAAAATYWLPSGQTASFAESEPMDDSDRAEMILPFPQVFLAFAEPLVLDPVATATEETSEKWRVASEITHDLFRDNGSVGDIIRHITLRAGPDGYAFPTIDQMISEFGAHVEGVLLLADSLGRPEDAFAWCLTIPGAYGSALGRFVVPARRSATEYRDVVDNLTAVVAWAQWHEPDQSTAVPLGVSAEGLEDLVSSKDFQRNAKRTGAGIRVVDVGSTHRGTGTRATRDGEGPDVFVTPHIRRGHWRRQRFGTGREQIKRIRIAPVLVNAHRGDIAPRVYRLRRTAKVVSD